MVLYVASIRGLCVSKTPYSKISLLKYFDNLNGRLKSNGIQLFIHTSRP